MAGGCCLPLRQHIAGHIVVKVNQALAGRELGPHAADGGGSEIGPADKPDTDQARTEGCRAHGVAWAGACCSYLLGHLRTGPAGKKGQRGPMQKQLQPSISFTVPKTQPSPM